MASMRSVLKLDISLGLFGFPVSVYKATNDPSEGVGFRQIHGACGCPIHQVKRCGTCESDVSMADLVKGFPNPAGGFVTFTEEEVKAVKPAAASIITIAGYVEANAIDACYQDGAFWYLKPDGKDDTTFATWRDSLAPKGRWAVGKVVLYGRERVVAIRALDKVLVMHAVRTHAEIRDTNDIPSYDKIAATAKAEYVAQMTQLVERDMMEFDDVVLESDAQVVALREMIDARLGGAPLPGPAAVAPVAQGIDLMAMLQASLAQPKQPKAA